jgi:hypothetical protein
MLIKDYIPFLHLIAMILATHRITEIITIDRISARFREKFKTYLWSCPRCVSVWSGVICTIIFLKFPWANWPFALAWIYIAHIDSIITKRQLKNGKELVIGMNNTGNVFFKHSDFNQKEIIGVANLILQQNKVQK